MKLLIAEDNRLNRMMLMAFMKEANYDILVAENGKEAYALWENEAPSILITDIFMPEMDGIELMKTIRNEETDSYTYIIVLTSNDEMTNLENCYEAGADDFLTKPFLKTELMHRLRAAERLIGGFERQLIFFALAQLTETRDFDTGQHIERISAFCKILANGLQNTIKYSGKINRRYIEQLKLSSVLHDIGKVGIDDAILKKAGRLTPAEFEEMKRHSILGADTLAKIQEKYPAIGFLKMAQDIARYHHEKYDGSGYPDGLRGEEIPLCARIVALADVYDALVTKRIYKEKLTHEEAKLIIIEGAGKHFDPDIVKIFVKFESRFYQTTQELSK